ncbi:MAG: hypothetical protein ABDH23_06175 [Endomicrobiia bacterium]
MKKILVLLVGVVLYISYISEKKLNYNPSDFFVFVSFSNFEDRDYENKLLNTEFSKKVFIECLYSLLIKEELKSFSYIAKELKKPFVKLWITKEILVKILKELFYIWTDVKKNFCLSKISIICLTILFVSLSYLKLNLKTYQKIFLVLRC